MPIRIFVTGGTFDKEYNVANEQFSFQEPHIPEMLRVSRCAVPTEVTTLMLIDSLEMTDKDRASILEHCQLCAEDRIIITHGTGTILETARVLGEAVNNKVIVLTGAVIPFIFDNSDSLFNLGSAFAFVQTLPSGVYVAMNGRYIPWNRARRNPETGMLEMVE
ncbi:MAG: asparaginase domain-containing protein [Patescibacteria group bacterium]